jgi:Zn-dependent protease with chaperone function
MHLSALPYHVKVKEHFFQQTKTWQFFAAAKTKDDQLVQFKTELLKNTYKFDPASDITIYDKANTAKQKLGLERLPVTIYQAQYTDELNASIVYLQNEAHIVFSGKVIQLLNEDELLAVLAHELTHVKLYAMRLRTASLLL